MNKEDTRKAQLALRKSLTESVLKERSRQVMSQAIRIVDESAAKYVHLFLPIKRQHEIDTWPLYHHLLTSESHTPVLSKTHFASYELSHHPMTQTDQVKDTTRGIPEPVHSREIRPEVLDLVFIPLIAFDKHGHRLGYGAGFYDRFLAQCRQDCLKVGLSLLAPLGDPISIGPYDIPMDKCITSEQVYDFARG